MLERKRAARNYHIVPGDEVDDDGRDVELGGVVGQQQHDQESGVIPASQPATITEELDNWDENAEDWDEDEPAENGDGQKTPGSSVDDGMDTKKRND